MKQHKDLAIVLSRVDYGEKDRILTLLSKSEGRISLLAKGVRSQKSRLAGGIELLSESEVCFIEGRSSLMTLTSARLIIHYGNLVSDIKRMQQAFSNLKLVNSIIDDSSGQEYYEILKTSLASLNDPAFDARVVNVWFNLQILKIEGSSPNLAVEGEKGKSFEFSYDDQNFFLKNNGQFKVNDIKLLRLCSSSPKPPRLSGQIGSEDLLQSWSQNLVKQNISDR